MRPNPRWSTKQDFFVIGLILFVPMFLILLSVGASGWLFGFAIIAGLLFFIEAGKAR